MSTTKQTLASLFVLVLMLLTTAQSSAEDAVPADRTIATIYSYRTFVVVQFDPPYPNSENCAGGALADEAAVIDLSQPDGEVMVATLLMARAMRHSIGLGINGCFAGWGPVPEIYRVDLHSD